jgi:hypothetical protein
MGIRIIPYCTEHQPAVVAFNSRLDMARANTFRLNENAPDPADSHAAGIRFEHFLAVDDEGEVHGGYFLRFQPLQVLDSVRLVGEYSAPLSEGVVDNRYAPVGPMMLAHAVKREPLLFASGMGGLGQPLPRIMKSLGWYLMEAPFWFLVLNGSRFLRNIGALRKDPFMRAAADFLAFTRLGGATIEIAQFLRRRQTRSARFTSEAITNFGPWAADVWEQSRGSYLFSAVRTPDYLTFNYPNTDASASIRLSRGGEPVGWINLLECRPLNASYFGQMKVTALVDGVSRAEFVPDLIGCAVDAAKRDGADLLFSNQTHLDWNNALKYAGFWRGPSNYLLGLSKGLARLLAPMEESAGRIHFNRGDGDGRVNLT